MKQKDLVLATPILARTTEEEVLIIKALSILSKYDIPIIAVDGGSPRAFLTKVKKISNLSLFSAKKRGLDTQLKHCLNIAAKIKPFVFYTESDKLWFFKNKLEEFLKRIEEDNSTRFFLAGRTKKAFFTFPKFQQTTEGMINKIIGEFLIEGFDYTYGPRIFPSLYVRYLEKTEEKLGWGILYFFLGIAKKLNDKVNCIFLDTECPPKQRKENAKKDKLYRVRQLVEDIYGFLTGMQVVSV